MSVTDQLQRITNDIEFLDVANVSNTILNHIDSKLGTVQKLLEQNNEILKLVLEVQKFTLLQHDHTIDRQYLKEFEKKMLPYSVLKEWRMTKE